LLDNAAYGHAHLTALEVTQLREIARHLSLGRVKPVPIVGHMLGGGHLVASRIAAVIAMAGIVSLPVSGSSAPGQAVVPDVVGMPVHRAYDAVHEAGFAVQIDEPFEFGSYVSDQSRAAGTAGRPGTSVVLSADGALHGLLPPGGTGRVPRLIGMPLDDAIYKLQTTGLLWGVGTLPPLPATMRWILLDNYEVAKQIPKPGTRVTQTVIKELPGGDIREETRPVGLIAKLKTP
jgi:PASTA domain